MDLTSLTSLAAAYHNAGRLEEAMAARNPHLAHIKPAFPLGSDRRMSGSGARRESLRVREDTA